MATDAGPRPAPIRSNEELNITVLRRHNPSVSAILSLAPFAVVYTFSTTAQSWEKSGIDGTLFVCQLTKGPLGEERYNVMVLNRRGMENFEATLSNGDDVEITDEYIILKVDGVEKGRDGAINSPDKKTLMIYGLWIFSEPAPSSTAETRTLNAQMIKECAVHGGESRKLAEERLAAERSQSAHPEAAPDSIPMNRQASLQALFGQQRAQDDAWSVRVHSPVHASGPQGFMQQSRQPANIESVLQESPAGAAPKGDDVIGQLFRKAGIGFQGQS
ncbi:hypothetical protein LOZ57_001041 [Ophidiomyces ophidiicola]|uniref:uncharacterized protein n=1 Tax=Ophidiomyces ophidiicola TaxID=1387563 RepID=UPI0020C4674C|nr:uncharacterized protein LOZ57_001041 [Ophidiomyces ophidiicola]KAI1952957.1 hypothetical protein LOZ57_001041 [Ophidiomyces ophidiicola]KAI2051514.1 hypothetical protein LOZ43_004722 [Ophidiomyces ophidiicola]